MRQAKADFICEKLEEDNNDSTKFWNNINSIIPGKDKSTKTISINEPTGEVDLENIDD